MKYQEVTQAIKRGLDCNPQSTVLVLVLRTILALLSYFDLVHLFVC